MACTGGNLYCVILFNRYTINIFYSVRLHNSMGRGGGGGGQGGGGGEGEWMLPLAPCISHTYQCHHCWILIILSYLFRSSAAISTVQNMQFPYWLSVVSSNLCNNINMHQRTTSNQNKNIYIYIIIYMHHRML